jgi:hypothetical protein
MSINLTTHFVQQYSSNIDLLLQQRGSKLRNAVTTGSHTGKAASPINQIGKVEMQAVSTRFGAMGRVDAPTDRRWVYPSDFDLPQLIDTFDELRMITDPKSSYVQNAVMAAGRQFDKLIITAFQASAATGEAGGTSTIFTANNEVDVAVGGANSKLNVAKLREVKRLMMANFVDFDMEEAFVGITAADHDALLGEIQVTNADYNGGMPVLRDGKIMSFMGFNFIHCELIETVAAGTNEVTLPVWVRSGVYLGLWNDIQNTVSQRHDLQGEPWQLYTKMTAGATRLEENKVYAIESYRA